MVKPPHPFVISGSLADYTLLYNTIYNTHKICQIWIRHTFEIISDEPVLTSL